MILEKILLYRRGGDASSSRLGHLPRAVISLGPPNLYTVLDLYL